MIPLRELDIMGVLIAPFAPCILLAAIIGYGSLWTLRRAFVGAAWTRSPSVELSLLVGTLSVLVLLLGRF